MQQRSSSIVLTGMGHWFPSTVLDNAFFDELDIGSSADWIKDRIGIEARRSVLSREEILALRFGQTTREELVASGRIPTMATMCQEPWRMAKMRSDLDLRGASVDTAIAGTSIPDWDIPANACSIASKLELSCSAFDVNSACSTFVVNLHVARTMLQSGVSKSLAIFNAERYTTRIDYADRANCILFGDSASAALVERDPGCGGLELLDTVIYSDPSSFESVQLPDGGVFSQNGRAVQKFAVTKTVAVTNDILARSGYTAADLSYFISHQANYRMLVSACDKLGIGPEQHLYNVDVCGNQGATGAPTVLSTHWDRYKAGDLIVVAVVGSGLSWGAALLRKL